MKKGLVKILMFGLIILAGCEDAFEYSPYAANVKTSYKDVGEENIEQLEKANTNGSNFKFAVFADSHYSYHELGGAVSSVNNRNDIDFVMVNGDIADHGYLKEFELFHERMKKLDVPYLTTIGNHDYRSNGGKIYTEMYGDKNYTVKYVNSLFIMWDGVFWESNKNPNFEWLEEQLKKSVDYKNTFVICHIPPFGSQFDNESENRYNELMKKYNIRLSIHGHNHMHYYGEYYKDGVKYLLVDSIIHEEYVVISVDEDNVEVEIVKY